MEHRAGSGSTDCGVTVRALALVLLLASPFAAMPASAQQVVNQAERTYRIDRGKTAVLQIPYTPARLSIGDTLVATVLQTTSPREWLINGLTVGTTTLILWDQSNLPHLYNIEVVPDATALQTQLSTVFPDAGITVATSGDAVILSGTIRDPGVARRALELATQAGARVINNLQAPSPEQILLRVRFAEVRHTSQTGLRADLFATNATRLDEVFGPGSTAAIETLSDGIVRLFLIGRDGELEAIIGALKSRGEFRSLAEPNLITLEGQEASFLAGGEFPYPTVQQGGAVGAVTVVFKEFGVRLNFTPQVMPSGTIRLKIEPEVSSLDFANGLTISGFEVPSLLTRRATSEVELRPGQHLAIAGLLDNSILDNVDKIPFLGDLPILGALFRNKSNRQQRTELLVIVTPHLIEPTDTPPALPTGEPATWKWDRSMRIDTMRNRLPGAGEERP